MVTLYISLKKKGLKNSVFRVLLQTLVIHIVISSVVTCIYKALHALPKGKNEIKMLRNKFTKMKSTAFNIILA